MAETEAITVAEVSDGQCGTGTPGTPVDLPVVELLTGRGFITGKSGSGKSNTASVVAEKLLDNGFGLLIVDIDGEYYGLKEEYEILHVGGDDECDIQVTVEHAEKIASLALEQNVPIILDVSSYLDEDEAAELLTEVSKQLFAKEKKLKQPFLMLVEEVHEWIPEKGSVGECGQMLIKIGKRGRKHGLGIVGISQRPADVKKDYITQCDWLVWHRLTWNNDTKVVKRIIDREHAEAVEDMDDGEAFLMTDWAEEIQRVQFQRKKTFDAGATPGLDDFERPDLKSVSDDLVSELESISEEEQRRENEIQELREELDRKNSRIAELEKELQDARDMQRMADQFTQALVEHVEGANPGRTEQERMRERRRGSEAREAPAGDAPPGRSYDERTNGHAPEAGAGSAARNGHAGSEAGPPGVDPSPAAPEETRPADDDYEQAAMTWAGEDDGEAPDGEEENEADDDETDAFFGAAGALDGDDGAEAPDDPAGEEPTDDGASDEPEPSGAFEDFGGFEAPPEDESGPGLSEEDEGGGSLGVDLDLPESDPEPSEKRCAWDVEAQSVPSAGGGRPDVTSLRQVKRELEALDGETRQMLRYYRDHGPGRPMDALFAAGGAGDRTEAYARNRELRLLGVIEHVGRGRYDYRLGEFLREQLDCTDVDPLVARVERSFVPETTTGGFAAEADDGTDPEGHPSD